MRTLAALSFVGLALALAGVAESASPRVVVIPDPVEAQVPVDVQVFDLPRADALVNGSLKTCLAKNGKAQFCLLPMPMRVENGTLVGRSADGFPAGEQVGVNVTAYYSDGTTLDVPQGIADPLAAYVFFTVEGGSRATPPAAGALAFAGIGAAALFRGRSRG